MTPHYADESVTVWHGDCLDVLRELPDASVDAVVTDPPYGLGFMGREWDDLPPGLPFAQECLRVLKPGGHLLAFGGTRTWHRLACAVEDAGFEVRDSIAWLYGSGFPKSLDVSKAIDRAAGAEREVVGISSASRPNIAAAEGKSGSMENRLHREAFLTAPATDDARTWQGWGTALKPAFEPIVVARKPLTGTVAANVLTHGTGALNIDGCRVAGDVPQVTQGMSTAPSSYTGPRSEPRLSQPHDAGRWPSNVVLDDTQAAELDRQSGVLTSGAWDGKRNGSKFGDQYGEFAGEAEPAREGSRGGASRFFPTFRYEAKAPTSERPRDGATAHPTVKPLDLMRWLVRLVTPRGGLVLDPFAGSGTTAEACILEGFRCVTIEREADYLPLITARLSKPLQPGLDLDGLLA